MSRKMKINRLAQDELIYELSIRGIGTGTCEQMRTSLSRAIQMEKDGTSLKRPPHPYTFAEDAAAVTDKFKDISNGIKDFNGGKTSSQYAKWETKLNHVLGRVELMVVPPEDDEKHKSKSELVANIFGLMTELDRKAKHHEVQNLTPAEISILRLEESSSDESEGEDAHMDQATDISGSSEPGAVRRIVRSTPVAKWNIHFSGEKKDMSLTAFLQRVEELRVARHVTKEELYSTAVDLFRGKALIWYRAMRREVDNWDALVKLLREEFQPTDYNEKLFEEIKRRTQGSDESIGIYLSVMSAMFNRLTCPVSEDVQLKIIMRNIAPFYQTQLGLTDVTSIAELRTLGRRLEARREAVEAFSPPSRKTNNTLEPDLAYVGVDATSSSGSCSTVETNTENRSRLVCYNCNKPGHKAVGCLERRRIHCYKCKREGKLSQLHTTGKRPTTFLDGRDKGVDYHASTTRIRPVLDFILDQCEGDERPYLKVNVLGKSLLGLLDSGASVTILGGPGWEQIKNLGIELLEGKTKIRVANGEECESLGSCEVPFSVRNRLKLVKVLVVTDLPHTLILGANFWRQMGIVPDLRHNEWHFSKEPQILEVKEHLRDQTVLSQEEEKRLQEVVDNNLKFMGGRLGCTDLVQHRRMRPPMVLVRSCFNHILKEIG
ncbi:hypothetical protein NQ318_018322 [Aromia moschata]|uniref:CCHC-type domain-containing protein n=1 Tax=Aromia moschata TaxID=1265417 RepID=A0AAV8ZGI5_9CUCU|nr:hypothetical protein NQ318_018322 [Aromia moschata]